MNKEQTINLIQSLGWQNLPLKDQEYLIEKTGGIVFQKIMARLLEKLTDSDKEEFDALLSNPELKDNELAEFIKSKIPNSDTLIQEEISQFLSETQDIMNRI